MPTALAFNVGEQKYNWDFHTVPQEGLDGRSLHQPRGKVLGGSSSLNAMAYVRGNAEDYERWAKLTGDKSWSYKNILPYYKRCQTHMLGENAYRGGSGPLKVGRASTPASKELNDAFVNAGVEAGTT